MSLKTVTRSIPGSANDATDLCQVGSIVTDGSNGKQYAYKQVEDMDLAANDVVTYADATGNEVTQDRAGGSSLGLTFAGVAQNTATDGYYTYIQTKGLATCRVLKDTSVSAGDRVMPHTTDDGGVIAYTATTSSIDYTFGMAVAADTATTSVDGTVAVMLDV